MKWMAIALLLAGCGDSAPRGLDTTFGSGGVVTVDVSASLDEAGAIAVQSTGKILVGGRTKNTDWDFVVVRLDTNGAVDTTFGTSGFVVTDFGTADDGIADIQVLDDGSFFAVGTSEETTRGTSRFAVARYTAEGALEPTFGTGGKLTTSIGSSPTRAFRGLLQADGKLLVGGETTNANQLDFALVRYSTTGTLDTTFSLDGKTTVDFTNVDDGVRGLAQATDQKLVVGGYSTDEGLAGLAAVRLDLDGELDASFGAGGKTRIESNLDARASSLRLDSQGRIVLTGTAGRGLPQPILARLLRSNGALDTSFGTDGQFLPALPEQENFLSAASVFSGSSLVVVGTRAGQALNAGALLISTFGTLNTAFGDRGLLEVDRDQGEERAEAACLQTDGKVLIAGSRTDGLTRDLLIARVQP